MSFFVSLADSGNVARRGHAQCPWPYQHADGVGAYGSSYGMFNQHEALGDHNGLTFRANYKQYSQKDMDRAVELVHLGQSTPQAALECRVPERSLYYKLSKCPDHKGKCRGASVKDNAGYTDHLKDSCSATF